MGVGQVRAILRAIWNGPFYIGKLTRPVSVGEVLLKILETVWRSIAVAVSVSALLTAGIMLWSYFLEPWLFPPLQSYLRASVVYDDGTDPKAPPLVFPDGKAAKQPKEMLRCESEHPIRVVIQNQWRRPIKSLVLSLEAFEPNRSTNLAENASWIDADFRVGPGHYVAACHSIAIANSSDPKLLIYKVKVLAATEEDD